MSDKFCEHLLDGNGDIIWEIRSFDIRHKTYEKLPEELKKTFHEFQVDCVIHENYSQDQISRLVRQDSVCHCPQAFCDYEFGCD